MWPSSKRELPGRQAWLQLIDEEQDRKWEELLSPGRAGKPAEIPRWAGDS